MKRFRTALVFAAILLLVCCWTAMAEEEGNSRLSAPDQPGQEDLLNQELWRFAKGTEYEVAERHIEEVREKRQAAAVEEIELPNGWKIIPAGQQVEVGRLPEEAVFYAGKIVVLNTGYYYHKKEEKDKDKDKDKDKKKLPEVSEEPEISIVDPAAGKVVKVLYPGSLFPCAVVGADGDLYISGGYDQCVYHYDKDFKLVKKYSVNGYAAGLAPIDNDHIAVVYLVVGKTGQGMLAILNTKTGMIKNEVETGYFPHTVRYLNKKLYVTILGEDKLNVYNSEGIFKKSLPVGKTPQDICRDPEANRLYVVNTGSDNLSVVDAEKDDVVSEIAVGSRGEGFGCGPTSCAVDPVHPERLLVTLAYSNAVGIFDKNDYKPLGFIRTAWYPTKVIAVPGEDWVAVLSAKGIHARRPKGKGPLLARRPNRNGPQPIWDRSNEDEYVLTLLTGTLGIIPRDQIIETNSRDTWKKQVEAGAPISAFSDVMPHKRIRHVFFIVRENRTYDQVLGDLGKGEGDPYLTLFGEKITPNAHKLANEFVTLDNYYANGEISVLGHSYTTSGYASPFMEWLGNMSYSGRYDTYPFGSVPAVCSPKYLWDELEKKKIDYRIYGENYFLYTRAYRIIEENFKADRDPQAKQFYEQMMKVAADPDRGNELYMFYQAHPFPQPGSVDEAKELLENRHAVAREISEFLLGKGKYSLAEPPDSIDKDKLRGQIAEYIYHYPIAYRSWDLKYSDLERVRAWKADFEKQLKQIKSGHDMPKFHYIWLPNDHTAGTSSGALSPFQLVAQNDAALGIIINTISHSPIWKESLILITEDDAQNGPDHVDATRTVALAVGPCVKRGAVVRDRYDQLSMLRTIEILLGLDPLNQNDALAVPMFDIFGKNPDETAYELPQPSNQLVETDLIRYKRLLEGEKKQP